MELLSNLRTKPKEFSKSLEYIKEISDIYSGEETIQFVNRHPIYKTLMKLEFEDALRKYRK